MEKKELKFYEAPELEVLNVNAEGFFCASGEGGTLPGVEFDDDED